MFRNGNEKWISKAKKSKLPCLRILNAYLPRPSVYLEPTEIFVLIGRGIFLCKNKYLRINFNAYDETNPGEEEKKQTCAFMLAPSM